MNAAVKVPEHHAVHETGHALVAGVLGFDFWIDIRERGASVRMNQGAMPGERLTIAIAGWAAEQCWTDSPAATDGTTATKLGYFSLIDAINAARALATMGARGADDIEAGVQRAVRQVSRVFRQPEVKTAGQALAQRLMAGELVDPLAVAVALDDDFDQTAEDVRKIVHTNEKEKRPMALRFSRANVCTTLGMDDAELDGVINQGHLKPGNDGRFDSDEVQKFKRTIRIEPDGRKFFMAPSGMPSTGTSPEITRLLPDQAARAAYAKQRDEARR